MGRPKGSRNKPKDGAPAKAPAKNKAPANVSGKPGTEGVREQWNAAAEGKPPGGEAGAASGAEQMKIPTREVRTALEERELRSSLAPAELLEVSARWADTQGALDAKRREIEALQKAHKDELKEQRDEEKALEEKASAFGRQVRETARFSMVPVRVEYDYGLMTVRYYRLDQGPAEVGEFYEDRVMTAAELADATFAPPAGERVDLTAEGAALVKPEKPEPGADGVSCSCGMPAVVSDRNVLGEDGGDYCGEHKGGVDVGGVWLSTGQLISAAPVG